MLNLIKIMPLFFLASCVTFKMEETKDPVKPLPVVLSCPKTKLILVNGASWGNKMDILNLDTASKRCSEIYRSSPCLKAFIKLEDNRYSAVCGAKQ